MYDGLASNLGKGLARRTSIPLPDANCSIESHSYMGSAELKDFVFTLHVFLKIWILLDTA